MTPRIQTEFDKNLEYKLGLHRKTIHEEKNTGRNSGATVPLNQNWLKIQQQNFPI
jgi:hypothetical protein